MPRTDTFGALLEDVRAVLSTVEDPIEQASQVAAHVRTAFDKPDWLEAEVAEADGNPHILHVDDDHGYPDPGFLVMCPTGEPGEERGGGTAHDHGPAWVVYANYRGEVEHTKYRWSHADPANPRLELAETFTLGPGEVTYILPGEIHATETVGEDTSWVLRLESQALSTVHRHWYDIEAGTVAPEA